MIIWMYKIETIRFGRRRLVNICRGLNEKFLSNSSHFHDTSMTTNIYEHNTSTNIILKTYQPHFYAEAQVWFKTPFRDRTNAHFCFMIQRPCCATTTSQIMSDKQVNIAVLKLHQSCGGKGNCVYQRRGQLYSVYMCNVGYT